MNSSRLLIVDDEPNICTQIKKIAIESGFDATTTYNGDDLRSRLRQDPPSALILNLTLSGEDGISTLNYIAERHLRLPIVLMSDLDERVLNTAERLGKARGLTIVGTLRKPFSIGDLETTFDALGRSCHTFTVDEFRDALVREQLTLHYQPIINVQEKDGPTVSSCEALIRWNHPRHGLLPPRDFIPFVEENGLMMDMTLFVLDKALLQAATWQQSDFDVPISVNVPVPVLSHEVFPVWLTMMLNKHNADPSKLILEVTERDIISDLNQVMETLVRIRFLGTRLSIDDFGTGHSCLRQLQQLPFNDLKIDRSFIMEMAGQEDARSIVRSTIDLAHALKLGVCAEGVETQAALELLREMGCEKVQGFLFSPAVAPEDLPADLSKQFLKVPGNPVKEEEWTPDDVATAVGL